MSKFKVGDRVRILHTYYINCGLDVGTVHEVSDIGGDGINFLCSIGPCSAGKSLCFYDSELEPLPNRTLTVGETYTTKGGRKLVCIFILDGVAFARFDHGNGVSGEAYRYNLDGTSISHGSFPDEYDIKFEPVVEWVEGRLNYDPDCCSNRIFYGEHDTRGQNLTVRFPLIDGKPDWSQATVTEA